jgi:hypothetical protein
MDNIAVELNDLVPSAYGSAIHASIEKAWKSKKLPQYLESLGIDKATASRVKVNPEPDEDCIPVYLEQRASKEINGWTVNGQFDAVIDGQLIDNKSMGTYGYLKGDNVEKFIMQGSIYRWLNPTLITKDKIAINYIFTDWSKLESVKNRDYPKYRIVKREYPLKTMTQTEIFIKEKLAEIDKCMDLPESKMPMCTDKDLWRDPPIFKVYKDSSSPKAMPGGSKFTSQMEAIRFASERGGIVKIIPSQVKRCPRCPAYSICQQRKEYFND